MERRALIDVSNQNNVLDRNLQGVKKPAVLVKPCERIEVERKNGIATMVIPKYDDLALDDFDKEVEKDIRYVCEYAQAIHDYYLQVEAKHLPNSNYMSIQTDITARMRAILIDWIVEVHQKFKMQPQTLYICVNVLDRYLERKVVKRDELQLIGCAALLAASKM